MPERKVKRKIIGITGSMGSGKSLVRTILSRQIPVTDCDRINARLLEPGKAGYLALQNAGLLWTGPDGTIDRKAMADALFDHPENRQKMEAILHPLIIEELRNWIEAQQGLCAAEVPLLFECSLQSLFDEIWTVTVPYETALKRLAEGRQIPQEEAARRLALQFPVETKIAGSDFVLNNSGTPQALEQTVLERLHQLEQESAQ